MTINHGYNKLQHSNNTAANTIVVNWCVTDKCNYRCSYCLPSLNRGRILEADFNSIVKFCNSFINRNKNKNIYFEFTGGEITIWDKFPILVSFLKDYENVSVGLISNGSRNIEWWNEIKNYIDHVSLSFQPEFSKKEHYTKLVDLLSNYLKVHCNIMMHPSYFELCKGVAEFISENICNVSLALQPLLIEFKDQLYDYTPDQLEIIDKQHELYGSRIKYTRLWPVYRGAMKKVYENKEIVSSAHRFISEKTNRWTGWKCYAGVEQIVVDLEGNVWRGWCKEGGRLGNIRDEVNLKPDPIICQRDYCHCNFDIMCTKEKV